MAAVTGSAAHSQLAPCTGSQYGCTMSIKQQFAEAVAALPESVSVDEAFNRLYRAFRAKQERLASGSEPPPALEVIQERLRRLASATGTLEGPVLSADALRREALYEDGP
jgi:hypothetical protein